MDKKTLGKQYEKELRKNITPAEKKFKALIASIKKVYGVKIKMQFQKGWYKGDAFFISDFYFPDTKCTIELDGRSHQEPTQILQDQRKSDYLESIGVGTIRVPNATVYRHTPTSLLRFLIENRVIKK